MAKQFYQESEILFQEPPKGVLFVDISDKIFGCLKVIGFAEQDKNRQSKWFCRCECGNIVKVCGASLKKGLTKSCGCMSIKNTITRSTKHGHSTRANSSPEYNTWHCVIQRTQNTKNKKYHDYGGRGITVCERWKSFENFFADMGKRPKGTTLDRIDNNLGYYKENCRWATPIEQANNTRRNVFLTYDGKKMTVSQWEVEQGFKSGVIKHRLKNKWPIDKAITTPVGISKLS